MKKLRKLSLKEELEKEAAEIEKELAEDPELDNLKSVKSWMMQFTQRFSGMKKNRKKIKSKNSRFGHIRKRKEPS